jgi:pimeloyl-ACP methyl ester carboxylesterase
MDAGLGGASLDWSLVQPSLQQTTRVCVYDRAGMGWSDARPAVPSPSRLAGELHTLLANTGETGPFVLVGHSLAGKNMRLFAAAYPDEVSGMVLVDARSELIDQQMSASGTEGFNAALKAQATTFSLARKVGLVRLLGAVVIGQPLLSQPTAARMALLQTEPAAVDEAYAEGIARSKDDEVLSRASLGSLPLVVIAAEQNLTGLSGWAAAQEAMARLSTDSRLLVAKGSGHYVQLEQPGLVISAVEEVVARVRSRH